MEERRRVSWLQRNWVALWAAGCLINATLQAWKWLEFRKEDSAIEAFLNLIMGIAFGVLHQNRRRDEEYREAMKKVREEQPFPWENETKASQ